MNSHPDAWLPQRRRTLLRLVGATATAGALETALATETAASSVVLEQGDRCVELAPLQGSVPVEELYDYTYPMDRFEGPPGSQGTTYSSEGTTDLQRDRTSVLFLYEGPGGLSLVVVHGHLRGDRDAGGTVTFAIQGLPADGSWIVRDDYYLRDGQPAESNFDRWDVEGDVHVLDWAYRGARTDGGAFRGLGSEFELRIDPAFNDEASLAADHDFGPIEAWEALSGSRDAPDRFPLRLDRPVTIRTGSCEQGGQPGGDDGGDDQGRDKHQRKQRKHRQKHQKKQRKHQKKQRKKQRKHRKHEKKQRKHQKKQRKHRKHGK